MSAANDSPESAVAMLQSIVDLYPAEAILNSRGANDGTTPAADEDVRARAAAIVQLARRRLVTLRADLVKQTRQQRADLRERLDSARRLSAAKPEAAAAMYRAIIDLYDNAEWAKDLVAEARQRLAVLKDTAQ